VSYVDAGYAICLSVLSLYAAGLLFRRRRLTRAAELAEPPSAAPGSPGPDTR
jgi:uncharacterized protein (TIGR03382 family)